MFYCANISKTTISTKKKAKKNADYLKQKIAFLGFFMLKMAVIRDFFSIFVRCFLIISMALNYAE